MWLMKMRASSIRVIQLASGAAAFFVLAALLVGIPLTLALTMGWPLPHHLPPLAGLRTSGTILGISDEALLDVLACVAWLAWFNIVISTIGNIASVARGSELPHIGIFGTFHPLTARLLGAVLLAALAFGRSQPTTSSSAHTPLPLQQGLTTLVLTADSMTLPTIPAASKSPISVQGSPRMGVVYTVEPGDSLWSIAQDQLGNPLEWRELFALNEGHLQSDGRALSEPDWIYPGWQLVLPYVSSTEGTSAATSGGTAQGPSSPDSPAPADTPINDPDTTVSPPVVRRTEPPVSPKSVPHVASSGGQTRDGVSEPVSGGVTTSTSIALPSGSLIAPSFAAGVLAALTLGRLRRRRHYQPGDPVPRRHEHPSPLTPTLRRLVEMRSERTREDVGGLSNVTPLTRGDAHNGQSGPETLTLTSNRLGVLDIGVKDQQLVSLDLTRTGTVELYGPRAHAIARSWCAVLLTAGERGSFEVLTTKSTANSLFPDLLPTTSMRTAGSMDELLRGIELEIISRSRVLADADVHDAAIYRETRPEDPLPFVLVVIDELSDSQRRRWHALSEEAHNVGLGVVILQGGSGSPTQIVTDARFLVTSASPGHLDEQLGHATLFGLEGVEAAEIVNAVIASLGEDIDEIREASPSSALTQPIGEGVADLWPENDTLATTHSTKPIVVRLLGPYQIRAHGEEVTTGLRSASRELLAWYLLRPDGATIAAAVEALWPDTVPGLVTRRFWRALGGLRSRLRDAESSDKEEVLIKSGHHYHPLVAEIECDLWEFEHYLGVAARAQEDSEKRGALRSAIEMYRGELVADVDYLWAEAAREDLHRRALDAHLRLAELEVARGDPDAAVEVLSRAVLLDRYAEEVFRRLMALLGGIGRRDQIVVVWRQLQQNLDELQLEPEPVTVRLYRELMAQ
jgi:DNA-binding SARP family transcriptional activator